MKKEEKIKKIVQELQKLPNKVSIPCQRCGEDTEVEMQVVVQMNNIVRYDTKIGRTNFCSDTCYKTYMDQYCKYAGKPSLQPKVNQKHHEVYNKMVKRVSI